MFEAPGKARISQLAIRKSPSMPMIDIAILCGGSGGDAYSDSFSKCPLSSSGRKAALPTTPLLLQRKLQSAVTLCVGILVCTIVLFVLVALDPSSKVAEEPWRGGPRVRVALPKYRHWANPAGNATTTTERTPRREEIPESGAALEGMGMLFRRGTRGMSQLIVAHLAESTSVEELRLFLRGLHRSGMPAHADVVLLFPCRPVAEEFRAVIRDEGNFFWKLLVAEESSQARAPGAPKVSVFNRGAYMGTPPPAMAAELTCDSIWGRRHNDSSRPTSNPAAEAPDSQPATVVGQEVVDITPHYGAVVGFDVQELDPDDALSGFLRSPSMRLRRWLCYQMLIGMVRHKYRHVLVTEVTGVVILTDSLLSSLKMKDASHLHLYATSQTWSQTSHDPNSYTNSTTMMELVYGSQMWNSLETDEKRKKVITTGVIVGGVRPVRSVAAAMATEIVRVTLLRKSRACFISDEVLLTYLVHKSSALGRKVTSHLQVHESGTSTVNLLPSSREFFRKNENRFAVIQGLQNGNVSGKLRNKILESLQKDFCQAQSDREIYTDCDTEPETIGRHKEV